MKKLLLILLCLPMLFSCGEKKPNNTITVEATLDEILNKNHPNYPHGCGDEKNGYKCSFIEPKNRYPIHIFLCEAFNYDAFVKKEEQNYFQITDNKLFVKNNQDSIVKSENFDCIKFMNNSICIYINNGDFNIVSSFGRHKVLKDIKHERVNLYETCVLNGGFNVENVYVFYNDKYEMCFSKDLEYASPPYKPTNELSYSSGLYIYDKSRSQHILDVRNGLEELYLFDGAKEYIFKGIVYYFDIKQEWKTSLSIEKNMILYGSKAFSKNLRSASSANGIEKVISYNSGDIINSEEWGDCN